MAGRVPAPIACLNCHSGCIGCRTALAHPLPWLRALLPARRPVPLLRSPHPLPPPPPLPQPPLLQAAVLAFSAASLALAQRLLLR